MTPTRRRPAASAALALAVLLAAVPACADKKKRDTGSSDDSGTTDGDRPSGDPSSGDRKLGLPLPPSPGRIVTAGWSGPQLAAERMKCNNDLKQIALGCMNFHDAMGAYPAGIYDQTGKKLILSWRVAILPYIEQENLYKLFKLDEPWDSEHNRTLISMIPRTYRPPESTIADGYTYYRSFAGPRTPLTPQQPGRPGQPGRPNFALGMRLVGIMDGTSNTFLAAEAAEPVIWTKPDELPFDPKGPAPKLGGVFEAGFNVAMCDGSVRFVRKGGLDEKTLRHLIDAQDGNVVNFP
jgi:prepilin-type processing-associated H-X9-DG protein